MATKGKMGPTKGPKKKEMKKEMKKEEMMIPPMKKGGSTPSYKKGGSMGKKMK
jgi:hypothetical protein